MSNSKLPFLFTLLLLGSLLFGACLREPGYPRLLVEADSAMRWGHYDEADSLLSAYNKTKDNENLSTRRYHQLLQLESKFLRGNSSIDDLLLVDSLIDYYKRLSPEKHAKTLAIMGDIYYVSFDFPSALKSFLKAEEEAERTGELWLEGIVCKEEGDIYLYQQLLDKMEIYYRKSYNLANNTLDSLRLVHAAIRMGKTTTYQQKADSSIYYYKQAISLGEGIEQAAPTVCWAKELLADIYLQIEDFDNAAAIMSRDSTNYVNWGYWHYQQHYNDSALYYFKKSIEKLSMDGKVEVLRLLAELEEKRGNTTQSLAYTKKRTEIEDSIKAQSQVAATLQAEAQHKLNTIQAQLDESKAKEQIALVIIAVAIVIVLLAVFFTWKQWKLKKATKDAEVAHERLLRQEEERRHQLSRAKIQENDKEIIRLGEELKKAQQVNDTLLAKRLKLDAEELMSENENIKSAINRRTFMLEKLENSTLYHRIRLNAGKEKFHLTDEEWQTLATDIDNAYDNFTGRLLALANLDDVEMKVCYLIKLEVPPSAIATMVFQSRGAITMKRRRMHEKLLHIEKGNPKLFDDFILNF